MAYIYYILIDIVISRYINIYRKNIVIFFFTTLLCIYNVIYLLYISIYLVVYIPYIYIPYPYIFYQYILF